MSAAILTCPICQQSVEITAKVMRCTNNHCFDQAKQGYWNLLAVQQKKSKDPGDNPQMVAARKGFLDLNHYQPLAERIEKLLAHIIDANHSHHANPPATPFYILDVGCGEGYYTHYWHTQLTQRYQAKDNSRCGLEFIGLDISKHAIKAATSRTKQLTWLVASGANIPVKPQSIDILSVVFSRLMPQPFAKVLKTQASLILVWPTEQHLVELKHIMYDAVKTSSYDPVSELNSLFNLETSETLQFNFTLSHADELMTLLEMTPHGQRINSDTKQLLLTKLPINLTFSVNIGHFKKRAALTAET